MYHTQENGSFVPICETVIRRYPDVRALPSHGVMDPTLCHGEIRLTLTARTPVMVCGGSYVSEMYPNSKNETKVALFARDARGQYRIPGASLRGLIRQNMQILGLGVIRVGREDDISEEAVAPGSGPHNEVPAAYRRPDPGLPASHRIPADQDLLDYPRSIMGFVGRKHLITLRNGKRKEVSDCYRTRVSVGDLTAAGSPMELRTVLIQQEQPYQNSGSFIIPEPSGKFRLKGIRQYPLREVSQHQPYASNQGFRPLAAGTQFTGTIRYRNLHEDELGLLLWCLRLEKGCLHTMGMAKAAGYGQMELKIDALVEYDPGQLYGSLTSGGSSRGAADQRIAALIEAYQNYAARQIRKAAEDIPQMPHIRTFLKLRGMPQASVETPKPVEPPKPAEPSQKELRRQAKKAKPQASAEQVSDWRAMLSSNFQKN